jgi:hypothetical protein
MMLGRPDGLKLLDLSADGFWNSFFAIVVAIPPLVVGWVGLANELAALGADLGGKLSIVLRLALIDLATWILPLVALAAVASRARMADRFVHLVVSGNWAAALFIWATVPVPLAGLIWPLAAEVRVLLSLALLVLNLFVSWRVINIALAKGAGAATAVLAGLFFASLLTQAVFMTFLGLETPS